MRLLRRLQVIVIVPLVLVIYAALRIPIVIQFFTEKPWAGHFTYLVLAAFTILSYYINFYQPLKENDTMKKKVWKLLNNNAKSHLGAIIKKYDCTLSLMIPKTAYLYRIEPCEGDRKKAKLSKKGKVFKIIWEYPDNKRIDKQLKISVNQGICGAVLKTNNPRAVDLTQPNINLNCFTIKQEKILRDYKIIACVPIYRVKDGADQQVTEVIGILNLHSKDPNSVNLLKTNKMADNFLLEPLFKISTYYQDLA